MKKLVLDFKKQIATLIIGAFSFVAALFWKDAIQELITTYIPEGSTWPYMLLSAIIVTGIAVCITYLVSKYLG